MSVDPDTYLKAAEAMPQGGLSAIAGDAISDVAAARLFSKHVAFRENELFLGMQSGSVDGYNLRGAAAFDRFNKDLERRSADGKRARSFDDILHLALIDNLNAQIAFLDSKIAEAEIGFEERYGEDWREQIAQRLLDPDDIPQREDGESMEEYRQRLEDALISDMLDENGEIKPEYLDDPEMKEWGLWAKAEYDKREAERDKEYVEDPTIDEAERSRRQHEVSESATFQSRDEMWHQATSNEERAVMEMHTDRAYDEVAMDNSGF